MDMLALYSLIYASRIAFKVTSGKFTVLG